MPKMKTMVSRVAKKGGRNSKPRDVNTISAPSMAGMSDTPTNDGRPKQV